MIRAANATHGKQERSPNRHPTRQSRNQDVPRITRIVADKCLIQSASIRDIRGESMGALHERSPQTCTLFASEGLK